MKSNIEYSSFSRRLTAIVSVTLLIGLVLTFGEPAAFYTILAIVVLLYVSCLFFAPLYLWADEKQVCIYSPLKIRSIPMMDVVKVERYRPQHGTVRLCASGGFMGYWGVFRDSVIKNYTGFWGKDDDCFLLTLANGKNYVLGCKNPDDMVAFIKSQI